ncbi:MAG: hypothetical protein WC813_02520 [Patescibacteria group bacterium]|jgi:hypothetical protein
MEVRPIAGAVIVVAICALGSFTVWVTQDMTPLPWTVAGIAICVVMFPWIEKK